MPLSLRKIGASRSRRLLSFAALLLASCGEGSFAAPDTGSDAERDASQAQDDGDMTASAHDGGGPGMADDGGATRDGASAGDGDGEEPDAATPIARYDELVDPFIGTGGGKNLNCFPGAVLPWGMVAASPDTTEQSENTTVEATMMILRRPALSDSQPTPIAASAQVNDSAEPRRPTCV